MSSVTLLAFAGFFFGVALHLYLFAVVLNRRDKKSLEIALLCLISALLMWYLGNFVSLFLRQMEVSRLRVLIGVTDSVAFTGLALLPALLLHTHWIYYRRNQKQNGESWIILPILALLYGQLLALPSALSRLFSFPAVSPLEKMGSLTTGYLVLLAVSYYASSFLEIRIWRRPKTPTERALFGRLSILFLTIPIFNFYVFLWGGREYQAAGEILTTLALLASLAPGVLVAYYISKHHFLHIRVQRSIATAFLILVTLTVYLLGIRNLGNYLEREFAAPPLLVEGTFLSAILLLFFPLSRWLERSQFHLERQLAQKSHMEDLGRMAATVAHNVKNPLSSMKTLMQLLREADNLTEDQCHEVNMMIAEVDRLSKTVTNLLKFSRLDGPSAASAAEEVRVDQLLDRLRSLFRGDLESGGLRLQVQQNLATLSIRADTEILSDVLANLLSNAIEASAAGDRISILVHQQDGAIEFTIEDEGSGIQPQIQERLFEPFQTTKASGTGLGLAIAKKKVEQLGGSIHVASPIAGGRGTRFTVRVPDAHTGE